MYIEAIAYNDRRKALRYIQSMLNEKLVWNTNEREWNCQVANVTWPGSGWYGFYIPILWKQETLYISQWRWNSNTISMMTVETNMKEKR